MPKMVRQGKSSPPQPPTRGILLQCHFGECMNCKCHGGYLSLLSVSGRSREMLIHTSEMHTFIWLRRFERKKISRLREVFLASNTLMTFPTVIALGMMSEEDTPESAGVLGRGAAASGGLLWVAYTQHWREFQHRSSVLLFAGLLLSCHFFLVGGSL